MKKYLLLANNIILYIFYIFVLTNCISSNNVLEKDSVMNEKQLKIVSENLRNYLEISIDYDYYSANCLSIKLYISNKTNESIGVPKYAFIVYHDVHGVTMQNCFQIKNENGKQPSYCGILAKISTEIRGYEDCVIFDPYQTYVIEIPNLFKSYEMDSFEFETIEVYYDDILGVSNKLVFKKP